MPNYNVTRKIEIDAGHRVMTHGGKCRHLHGHRYKIEATCRAAALHADGGQTDMAIDFFFLKEEMERAIDAPCDHGFIAALGDADLLRMFCPDEAGFEAWLAAASDKVARNGFFATTDTRLSTKLYVLDAQPTAECLAAHWFSRLAEPVRTRSGGVAELARIRVWETPNCYADFEA